MRDLTATYKSAREFAADEHAARTIEPHQLASAILSLAATRTIGYGLAALAEDTTSLKQRVLALLEDRAERTGLPGRRIVGVSVLVAIAFFSLMPAVLSALNYHACMQGMSA